MSGSARGSRLTPTRGYGPHGCSHPRSRILQLDSRTWLLDERQGGLELSEDSAGYREGKAAEDRKAQGRRRHETRPAGFGAEQSAKRPKGA